MTGRPGYKETEANLIRRICQPKRCIYSQRRTDDEGQPRCGTKYSEEVVLDFAEDGCMTAAIAASDGNPDHIIPGTMTSDGFIPFPSAVGMTRSDHQRQLDSAFYPPENRSKVVYTPTLPE